MTHSEKNTKELKKEMKQSLIIFVKNTKITEKSLEPYQKELITKIEREPKLVHRAVLFRHGRI